MTIAASHAAHDTYSAFLPPMLPIFIEKLSLAKAEAGLLTVFLQAPSLLQPFFGHIGDRRDLRTAVVLAPTVTAAGMCLLGIAPSYAVTILLLMTVGLSAAVLHSVAPVIVGRISGRRLGFAMGFWMVGGELGRTLGPVLFVSAIAVLGLESLPWLMVGGLGASVLLMFGVRGAPPPPRNGEAAGNFGSAVLSLRTLFVPLFGVIASRSFPLVAYTIYLPLFLREQGVSLWMSGASLSILEAAGVVGALVGGSASDRFGRKRVLAFSLLATPVLLILFIQASGWGRLPLLLGLGFFGLMTTPVIMASVQESSPENRALANGVYMALNFGVRALIVVLVGWIGDGLGMQYSFLVCAALGLLGVPFVFLLPGRADLMDTTL